MMKKRIVLIITILILVPISGCAGEPAKPEGAVSVAELLAEPVYESPILVFGQVMHLGEVECACFSLESDDGVVHVWYDMMLEDDGFLMPAVSIEGINNGDWVVVSGVLKPREIDYNPKDFWASSIEVLD